MIKKKVSVHVISDRCVIMDDGDEALFAPNIDGRESDGDSPDANDEKEHIEEISEGYMTVIGDTVNLLYTGSPENFMADIKTKLTFNKSNPELVTILRTGGLSSAMTFQPHKRNICVYAMPFGQFEIAVSAKEVDNRLLDDGVLVLDYNVEIHGTTAERTKLVLTVKDIPAEK